MIEAEFDSEEEKLQFLGERPAPTNLSEHAAARRVESDGGTTGAPTGGDD